MKVRFEPIIKVEVLRSSELQLVLASGGSETYQHVYREARGVYWDNEVGAFRGTDRKSWSYAEWFAHIVEVCGSIGIRLQISDDTTWQDVPDPDKERILDMEALK